MQEKMSKDLLSEIKMQEYNSFQHIQAPMLKVLMGLMYLL